MAPEILSELETRSGQLFPAMLTSLEIRNLAVVDEVHVELAPGMTVLTGETGAGKSILVDALALALGTRADSGAVRPHARRAEVSAGFDVGDIPDLAAWLEENDLDEPGECIIRRVVGADGRSRGYINGNSVPMQTLREAGQRLVDICGQQAHQRLASRAVQRAMLDHAGGHPELALAVRNAHEAWAATSSELANLRESLADRDARRELLTYQLRELETLGLADGEIEQLQAERRILANASTLSEGIGESLAALFEADEGSAWQALTSVRARMEALSQMDASLEPVVELLGTAEIHVAEAADALRGRLGAMDSDPARLDTLEARLDAVGELARKHRVEPSALPGVRKDLARQLDEIEDGDARVESLIAQQAKYGDELAAAAGKLTKARNRAARKMGETVSAYMQELGMPGGRFEVALHPVEEPRADGAETVEFRVSANPGMPTGPLDRVASGGELSRISLAVQITATADASVPTLIFDEVDAGVGGGVAEIVGRCLRDLGSNGQTLCVTHLPQVASLADQHLRVTKVTDGKVTRTAVRALTADERVEEIARMLGGVEITEATRAHAAEMLAGAGTRKAG